MRKVISLFLAAAVLCLSTAAMAAPTPGTVSGMRKSANNTLQGSASNTSSMPCFRPGDTITFDVSALTLGEELTVISYKNGASESDSTVQYINQYTVGSTGTQSISYTIRNQASGVYVLKFNGTTSNSATFYYKIGNATVQVLDNDAKDGNSHGTFVSGYGDPYIMKRMDGVGTWSIGFIGKVTVDSGDITLSDIGATPGFQITNGSKTKSYGFGQEGQKTVANLESVTGNAKLEISGSYSFIYGLTLYDVPNGTQDSYTAQAVVDVQ